MYKPLPPMPELRRTLDRIIAERKLKYSQNNLPATP